MTSALFSALSGLQAHESWISVIGNNIANASTPGFKSSRALFSDQFSQTLRFASLPSGSQGGRNPMQLGLGVQLADIGRNMDQGVLSNTGRTFDLALNGKGYFMVSDGNNTLYTRVGTFGMDASSQLVDQRTGFRVIGLDGQPVDLDTASLFPPSATNDVTFAGNLPAVVGGPLAQVMTTSSGLKDGTSATMTGGVGPYTVPVGSTYTMELVINGGAPQTVSVTNTGAGIDATDVVAAINALPNSGIVASVTGANEVQLDTVKTGAAATIKVVPGATGANLASTVGLATSLVKGTETVATSTAQLNDLTSNQTDYVAGDTIDVSGIDSDGTPVSASFTYGGGVGQDGTTVADMLAFIDNLYPNATASLNATTGQIQLTADATGASGMSIAITDNAGTGATNWSTHAFTVTTAGTGPDTTSTSIEVFDQAGVSHTVNFTYTRQDDGSWNVDATIPSTEGTVLSGTVSGLVFNDDGSIGSLPSTPSISIQFTGQSSPQNLTLDFGTPGLFDGVTQLGGPASAFADRQDGFGVGELSNMSVNGDGDIQGFYTNGQIDVLGSIGVATFVNDSGLREIGSNLWAESPNSGTRTVSGGAQGKAGAVVGGSLEGSNVAIAEEFVRLIEAQRGFQANARVISTTSDVLAELNQLL
ncbi:MAG: flagellar hook-basal body complex protein [Planctomycetes bacterium]|nr:flagellar hook-basal body complex protein [Planctomycetota bacterium]